MQPEINTQQKDKKHKKKNRALLLLLVILLLIVGFISNGIFSFLSRNTLNRNELLSASPIPLQSNIPTDITFEDNRETVIPSTPEEIPPLIASTSRIRPLVSVPNQSTPVVNTPTIPNTPGSIIINATLGPCTVICASINTSIISGNPLILERGIVYDNNPNPTIEDTKVIHSDNQLSYNSEIQNMRIINTYYIRSYVITPSGITYSNQIEINKPLSTPHDTEPGIPFSVGSLSIADVSDITEIFANLEGEGTARSPYIITNDWELQSMNQDLDAHYRLGNNIDARGTITWNGGQGFTPIGGDGFNDTPFTGHFDGNGYGIIGLTIDREGNVFNEGYNYYIGLFARTDGAKLYNVVLQDHYILGRRYVGAIVGYVNGETEIRNAVVDGVSWARFGLYGGGLVGWMNNGLIDNSFTDGQVHGSGQIIGGIVGLMQDGTITNTTSNANVDGGSGIGGFVGELRGGHIINSCANGEAEGIVDEIVFKIGSGIGGFVGDMSGGSIKNSHATGDIRAEESNAGGFIGIMGGGAIHQSYATGDVYTGVDNGGGFIGAMYNVSPLFGPESIDITIADISTPLEIGVHNSYATGNIIFTNKRNEGFEEFLTIIEEGIDPFFIPFYGAYGGFIGENRESVVRNSYSSGKVIYESPGFTNPTNKGFSGKMTFSNPSDIDLVNTNNYWNTETSQQSSSAGNAIGLTSSQMLQQDSFNTWNFNTIWQSNGTSTPQLRNNANCKFTCFKPTPTIPLPPVPTDCINPPITNGLVQYLDVCASSYAEQGTDIWRDLSSNNLDLSLIPEIGYDTMDGGSLLFSDLSGSLYSQLDIGNDFADSTHMMWLKPTIYGNLNSLLYINSYDQLNSFYSDLYLDDTGVLNLNTGSAIWNESITDYDYINNPYNLGITLESDKWYHIAVTTTNNGPIQVYINQQPIFTSPNNHSFSLTDLPAIVDVNYINRGNLSHISVYDTPLSLSEIQQFFNTTQSRFTTIGDVIPIP